MPNITFIPNILLLNLRNKLFVGLRQKNENFSEELLLCHKSANGPPKREREREQLHYSIKKQSTYPEGKGRRKPREDECPKSSPKSRQHLKSEKEEKAPKARIDDEHNTKCLILFYFLLWKNFGFFFSFLQTIHHDFARKFCSRRKAGKCSICAKLWCL